MTLWSYAIHNWTPLLIPAKESSRAALTGIEISPDPLGEQLLEKARLSGWDEKRIIQLMIDQAGRDRDIAMPYKEMNL